MCTHRPPRMANFSRVLPIHSGSSIRRKLTRIRRRRHHHRHRSITRHRGRRARTRLSRRIHSRSHFRLRTSIRRISSRNPHRHTRNHGQRSRTSLTQHRSRALTRSSRTIILRVPNRRIRRHNRRGQMRGRAPNLRVKGPLPNITSSHSRHNQRKTPRPTNTLQKASPRRRGNAHARGGAHNTSRNRRPRQRRKMRHPTNGQSRRPNHMLSTMRSTIRLQVVQFQRRVQSRHRLKGKTRRVNTPCSRNSRVSNCRHRNHITPDQGGHHRRHMSSRSSNVKASRRLPSITPIRGDTRERARRRRQRHLRQESSQGVGAKANGIRRSGQRRRDRRQATRVVTCGKGRVGPIVPPP